MLAIPDRLSIFKRHGIFYLLYYVDGKRRWKSTHTSTRPEALKALTSFRELLKKRIQTVSLAKFVQDFLVFAEANYRPGTVALYRHTLSRFQLVTGDISLPEASAGHFDKYKSKRLTQHSEFKTLKRQRSVSTVNWELRTLRAALATARRWGLIERNPFAECTLCPVPERSAPYFAPQDFEKLLIAIGERRRLRDAVMFAIQTGLRRGELLSLTWPHVGLTKKLVLIESSATSKTKGGKRRFVPLSEPALTLLRSRQGLSPSEFVFTKDDAPIDEDWLTHAFKKAVIRAKLPASLHWHSLRHSTATLLMQNGATMWQVSQVLGHLDIATTRIYAHEAADQLHSVVNKLDLSTN